MSLEFVRDSIVIGKKQHKCIWCGESILVDEEHHYRVYKFDGDFMVDRFHKECFSVLRKSKDFDDGFEPYSFTRGTDHERGCGDASC